MKKTALLLCYLCFGSSITIAATPWQTVKNPVQGPAQSIGGYSNGCIIGAQALPIQHAAYQILKPQQRRYFGHPTLIHYLTQLANTVHQHHLGTLLIGDMGMPAGGRFTYGHRSHQTGLDVDIWLQLPQQRWSQKQLRSPTAINLVNQHAQSVIASRWQSSYTDLVRFAASDPRVSRLFVHPTIKKQLCSEAASSRDWLSKVRPWFGHRAHMHIRLHCPTDSPECNNQLAIPEGDGCGEELTSWLKEKSLPNANPHQPPPPPLPALCHQLQENWYKTGKMSLNTSASVFEKPTPLW